MRDRQFPARHMILVCSLLITFNFLHAQKTIPHDSNYYETFPDKLTIRLYSSQKYVHLNFPSNGAAEDLEYKANPKFNLGAGFTWRKISLNIFNGFSFLNTKKEPKGKTKGLDLQLHVYPRKWTVDVLAVLPKGFHLEPTGVAGAATGTYYYRPDVKTSIVGLAAYRIPNKERFSYRAAIQQSEWQKKSAGSILYGGEVYHGTIQGDSVLIPELLHNSYPQTGVTKLNFLSFGPGIGYAHTLVFDEHFFITGSMILNLDVNFTREEGIKKDKEVSFNPAEVFKAAVGYNSSNWNLSANWTGNGLWIKGHSSPEKYFFPSGNVRLVLAHRFEIHKHHS